MCSKDFSSILNFDYEISRQNTFILAAKKKWTISSGCGGRLNTKGNEWIQIKNKTKDFIYLSIIIDNSDFI